MTGTNWPAQRHERRAWHTSPDSRNRSGRRPPIEDRQLSEIDVSIPATIASRPLDLNAPTVREIDRATASITRLDENASNQVAAISDFLLRSESVATSRIERIVADVDDLARASVGANAGHDARVTVASAAAIADLIERSSSGIHLDHILHAHERLLRDDPDDGHHAGRLRTMQNWVGGGDFTPRNALYVPPPPDLVPDLMADLVAFVNRDDLPPIAIAALAHAQFESIHPFTDGNGRIGRALINAALRRHGLTRRVAVPIASVMLADVDAYFAQLETLRDGDADGMVRYVAKAAATASDEAAVSADELRRLPAQWRDVVKVTKRGSVTDRLIDHILAAPVVTSKNAALALEASQTSVLAAIENLAAADVLSEITGQQRDRVWLASEVFDEVDRLQERIGPRRSPSTI
jgi:Fic family protein